MDPIKDINEVMIGDYVYMINELDDTEQVCKITALKDKEYEQIWKNDKDNDWFQIKEAYPIPLSNDILLANGFDNISEENHDLTCLYNGYCISYFPMRYKLVINTITYNCTIAYNCQYVHEMQNIFNILHIDKKIIL